MISIVIPVHNGEATLKPCLDAVLNSTVKTFECIVVDDASTDGSMELAKQYPVRILELDGGPKGPAFARNEGAKIAAGEILFFIDSDVVIQPNTLEIVLETFQRHPEISALFGSYDETPAEGEFISQYKNLLHHFVHQQGHENASTFWSGCGAVLRSVFMEMGGFDASKYPRPSIEDIELGLRMKTSGHKILLNKDIQVKHLKRWSLGSLIKTDVLHRAIPWTWLIFQYKQLPNDLNLQLSQRISTVLLIILLSLLGWSAFQNHVILLPLQIALFVTLACGWHWQSGVYFKMTPRLEQLTFLLVGAIGALALYNNQAHLLAPLVPLMPLLLLGPTLSNGKTFIRKLLFGLMMVAVLAEFALLLASYPIQLVAALFLLVSLIMLLNIRLYLFFARRRGVIFAFAALPLQLLYYFYSGIAFAIGSGIYYWNASLKAL